MSAGPADATRAGIGVTGLGVMGTNLARNFARHGFTVAVHNRDADRARTVAERYGGEGDLVAAGSMAEFVASIERPRKVLVMVPAGAATESVVGQVSEHMEPGDVVIDGGNAHFEDTRRREAALRERGLHFVGVGVSGGEEGALEGPSIMPGGSVESYATLGPMLERISAKADDGAPCCTHVGPDGAGHFVKMVHNGIEYADMQLIAEAYDLLRHALDMSAGELADVFAAWNTGDLESFLIETTAEVLAHTDAETGRPFVDVVADRAAQKGTGRWTVQNALDLGVPITGIAEATFARGLSAGVAQRAAGRSLPGRAEPWSVTDREAFVEDVRQALYASKVVAYSQGFEQIAAASAEYGWDIDRGAMARIWRAGCIIRARFLDRISDAYAREGDLPLLLADEYFTDAVSAGLPAWRRVVAAAARHGVPAPAFSASLAYYDGIRAERVPANLIQAQRDFFGAHTYQRTDREGTFHTLWSGDRTEVRA